MKRFSMKKVTGMILAAAMMAGMTGCGSTAAPAGSETETTSEAQAGTEAASSSQEALADTAAGGAAAEIKKVALILPGVITDQSWNTLAYNALEDMKEAGFETAYTESVQTADAENTFRTYADQGYHLIIGHGSEFTDAAVTVAPDYPDIYFFCTNKCPDGVTPPDNLGFVYCKEYEASYLCGVAAATMTKSKVVGFLGGIESASQIADKNAFIAGVASVDPEVRVITVMSGSFDDSALGKESATSMIEQKADVLMHTCDTTGLGLVEACKDAGVYIIGYGSDQQFLAPELVITSCIADTKMAIEDVTERIENGTFGGTWTPGMAENIVYLGEFGSFVPQEVKDKVEEVKEQIISGELVVENKETN